MVITMGVLSLFHIEIDLTIVAPLMSVIGYSLNDSIVVAELACIPLCSVGLYTLGSARSLQC
ncbi:hypothetical protein, partial [Enterococcus faecium]|uniref:hypothetical protein n=1 Tax=Enterococcus faecium TaxID=1352 RepID=UPI001C4E5877